MYYILLSFFFGTIVGSLFTCPYNLMIFASNGTAFQEVACVCSENGTLPVFFYCLGIHCAMWWESGMSGDNVGKRLVCLLPLHGNIYCLFSLVSRSANLAKTMFWVTLGQSEPCFSVSHRSPRDWLWLQIGVVRDTWCNRKQIWEALVHLWWTYEMLRMFISPLSIS